MHEVPKPDDVSWLAHRHSSLTLSSKMRRHEFSTPHRSLLCSQGFFEDYTDRDLAPVEWLRPRCRRCTPPDQPITSGCGSTLMGLHSPWFRPSSSYIIGVLTIRLCPSCSPSCTSKNGWVCYGSWNCMMASAPSHILDDHGPFLTIDVGWMVNQWVFPTTNFKSMGIPNYKFQWSSNGK